MNQTTTLQSVEQEKAPKAMEEITIVNQTTTLQSVEQIRSTTLTLYSEGEPDNDASKR